MTFCFDRPRRCRGIVGCLVLLVVACLHAGCGHSSSAGGPAEPLEADARSVANVARNLVIGNLEVRLGCTLTRDVPAAGGPADPSLTATVRVTEARGRALPPDFAPDYLWIFHDRGTWSTELGPDSSAVSGPERITRTARGGPMLEPGKTVEIVVRIRVPGGADRVVKVTGVRIGPKG